MKMSRSAMNTFACCGLAGLAVAFMLSAPANATDADTTASSASGKVDFDYPDAPPASFELNLSQGMFKDLFGIGDAAFAGVAETLLHSAAAKPDQGESTATAEELESARQIVQLCGQVMQGVRVSTYDQASDSATDAKKIGAYYDQKLRDQKWDTVVRVRDGDETYVLSVKRAAGAIKGVFVFATDGDEIILTNVECDISPENAKKLTSTAAKIGLTSDVGRQLTEEVCHLKVAGKQLYSPD